MTKIFFRKKLVFNEGFDFYNDDISSSRYTGKYYIKSQNPKQFKK